MRHRGHDVILFQMVDDAERTLGVDDLAVFEGLEGESRAPGRPAGLRDEYVRVFDEHIAAVQKACPAFGLRPRAGLTHDWLGPPLAAFIARRQAQMKRTKMG
jgi:hypothetical protein